MMARLASLPAPAKCRVVDSHIGRDRNSDPATFAGYTYSHIKVEITGLVAAGLVTDEPDVAVRLDIIPKYARTGAEAVSGFDLAPASIAVERTEDGLRDVYVSPDAIAGLALGEVMLRHEWVLGDPPTSTIRRTMLRIHKYASALGLDGSRALGELRVLHSLAAARERKSQWG